MPVRTLSEMKRKFGEEDKRISYLKVDVEGSEIKAGPTTQNLSEWRQSLGPLVQPEIHLSLTPILKPQWGSNEMTQ